MHSLPFLLPPSGHPWYFFVFSSYFSPPLTHLTGRTLIAHTQVSFFVTVDSLAPGSIREVHMASSLFGCWDLDHSMNLFRSKADAKVRPGAFSFEAVASPVPFFASKLLNTCLP